MCGSGQQAVHFAAQAILAGDMDLVIAGGIEMMSHQPLGSDYPEKWPEHFPHQLVHQGVSAEMMADEWALSREELDDYAFASHTKAAAAIQEGHFDREILAIEVPTTDGASVLIKQDPGVRMNPDREKMGQLKPVFKEDGVITAGNSSQISDGAGALLIASERAVRNHNLKPLARILARSVVGSDPVIMLDAPIPVTRSVLERTKLNIDQIDVIELNEAFASVVLAWQKEIGGDMQRVNPNGGAIAHGHPLGATGAVLVQSPADESERYRSVPTAQELVSKPPTDPSTVTKPSADALISCVAIAMTPVVVGESARAASMVGRPLSAPLM